MSKAKLVIKRKDCMICYENEELYNTSCCSFKMCKFCVLENAKTTCPHCNKELPITRELKIILSKQEKIDSLEKEVRETKDVCRFLYSELKTLGW